MRRRNAMNTRRQIQLSPEEQTVFFREQRKAALATLDQDGFPHVVAMNYFAKDGAFYMTSYGKAQKVVNIRRDPRVALMIEAGNAYAELRGVMVRGRCEIIEGADAVRAAFAAMAEARGTTPSRPSGASDSG
jgi:PPOX class probable F420-dependent enzyme